MAGRRSTAREYLEALLIAGIFLGFTNTFLVKTFFIPSASMEKTLLIGDHLFVNRFIYGPAATKLERKLLPLRLPRRGDIVVFRSVEQPQMDLVKRDVGLPGDKIQVIDKDLYVNGKRFADQAYVRHVDPRTYPDSPLLPETLRLRDHFGPFTVPPHSYFCMGDNRDVSYDSRFWGPVPRKNLLGRPLLIYWSYGGQTSNGTWPGWGAELKHLLDTALGFFTKTRWSRTFRLIR
ncbi:MAG TPA: signal peptidase I [Thermoanaerobaculia bacterium]|nr:signal peptidase I [Thermoanaerobaculia bacterium]